MGQTRRLILVSLDAVDDKDVDDLMTLPNFSALAERGTLMRRVESVFVSNTYPAHASVMTGVSPARHGITENVLTRPGISHPPWRRFSRQYRVPTLYGQAARAGLSVASVLYPVTCGAREIRWNFPEIPGGGSPVKLAGRLLAGGSAGYVLRSVWRRRGQIGMAQPKLDDFTLGIALDTLRRYRPELLLLHLLDADDHKHAFGPGSGPAREALRRHDRRLGELVRTAEECYGPEGWSILLFGDHGCLPVHTAADPNDGLRRMGLIRKRAGGGEEFDAFFHNAGGTSFLKLYRRDRTERAWAAVEELLRQPFAGRLLSRTEMDRSGMGAECLCGLEAADGFCFGEFYRGQHGYGLNREGYRVFYLAAGAGVPEGAGAGGSILDICPLAAALLELPPWKMEGQDRVTGRGWSIQRK